MKKTYYLLLILLLVGCSSADNADKQASTSEKETLPEKEVASVKKELKVELLTQAPAGIAMLGKQFVTGRKWTDGNGENLLLFSFNKDTEQHPSGDDAISHELYAEHFAKQEGAKTYTLLRKVQDFEKACILENMLILDEESIKITNLDGNQYKEISFVYTIGCRSDMSPCSMKLMLLENGEKYAVRGYTRFEELVRENLTENAPLPESTTKTFDPSFDNAPAVFKQFANKLWNEHELE